MNKNQKNVRFCFFSWFFKNCELIRDSSLWCSNFIPSVCDSVIIIGLRSITYTFGSHFIYKRWVRVSIKIWILAFLGKYSKIICWVSKCVDWGSHHPPTWNHSNEKKKHEVLLLLLVLQELWTYQRFFLMAFKFYTFGSWFSYNHWVEVWYLYLWFVFYLLTLGRGFYQNLNFSFLRQVFQYYLLGFKACWLRFASTNPPIP